MRSGWSLTVGFVLGLAACGGPDADRGWRALDAGGLTEAEAAQKREALAARSALFQRLLTTLQSVMKKEGPVAAIAVCRGEAPRIAAEVSEERGLRIGRTAARLRNPDNTPPAWAEGLVRARVEEPRFLAGPDGELAALLPIRLKAACLTCHGPSEAISPEVAKAIAANYPTDRATGFRKGDLRGWFWIEVPKRN
jgi:hypothetical protein